MLYSAVFLCTANVGRRTLCIVILLNAKNGVGRPLLQLRIVKPSKSYGGPALNGRGVMKDLEVFL